MIELTVKDMTCGHCASSITRAVKDVDAAGRCEIDLAAKKVRIESRESAQAFVEAIEEAGFTPELAAGTKG